MKIQPQDFNPNKSAIEKAFDPYFDKAWSDFVKHNRKSTAKSNHRMFKLLIAIKGLDFVTDLKSLIKQMGIPHAKIRVSRIAKGMFLRDKRFKTIPELCIDKSNRDGVDLAGSIYIQIKESRFIRLDF